jgi:DNA-binding IclR family transcriptional regulator
MMTGWWARRRAGRVRRVLDAIDRLRPEWASALFVARVAGLAPGTAWRLLQDLERRGLVTARFIDRDDPARWSAGPDPAGVPRRRVYVRIG